MKALTGMTVLEFESLVITFSLVLQKYQATRKKNRTRAVGGGRKHTLTTAAERLFFILFYVKCYPTMDVAAFFFGVDRSASNGG
ncbi:MAG: transposase family protein [Anaerolineae bacterium]|nr:transposase family protein [Anaerolineae bacterium]